jgi:hypothetical protein
MASPPKPEKKRSEVLMELLTPRLINGFNPPESRKIFHGFAYFAYKLRIGFPKMREQVGERR